MMELTSINPYTLGSDKGSNKRGMCAFETARKIRRMWKDGFKKFEKLFGCSDYPEQVVCSVPFKEQSFGILADEPSELDENDVPTIVSLALFNEDEMLFACTGIALPDGILSIHLTRILTSARLVTVFNEKRNRDDTLRIEVRVPHHSPFNGFLELYDEDIAIVTSLTLPNIIPVDLDLQNISLPVGTDVQATGRTFKSFDLMVVNGKVIEGQTGADRKHLGVSDCHITEAGLGGPLFDSHQNFVGMNISCALGLAWFLPHMLIRERLEQYQILIPRNTEGGDFAGKEHVNDLCCAGSSSGTTKISSQGYSPPPGASVIVPSGFLRRQKFLDSLGYPKPPPLMLELNGRLLNTFEEPFGYLDTSSGYLFDPSFCADGRNPWLRLRQNRIQQISRCVVSLASFNEASRFFACTGLLIKCRVGKCYGSARRSRTVVLTSASLVRTCDATDTIDEKLRIEVFLPPNQRVSGTLVAYDSFYNVAIVSVEHLRAICPEDALLVDTPDHSWDRQWRKMVREEREFKHVVAVGREADQGLLCGSMGVVSTELVTHGCEDLRLSTCKIKKAGIGGPLYNYPDGSFAGMNFYDGRINSTPFLPRRYILKVLRKLELPPAGRNHLVQRLDTPVDGTNYSNRWPVPKARWYNSILEADRPFKLRERQRL